MSHHHTSTDHTGTEHDGTDVDWEERADLLEAGAEQQRPLYEQAIRWIAELTPPAGVRRILDIGSGPGVISALLAEAFPAAEVVPVDSAPALLKRARARAERAGLTDRIHPREAELPDGIPELGETDLIWAGDSLHHLGDQAAAIAGFGDLLRPGGLLALLEGGLPARHLPRDIGIGRPGLEARMEVARGEWFARMRADLPGATDTIEDWSAILAEAGLRPAGVRSFLLDLPAPLPRAAREQLVRVFDLHGEAAGAALEADDRAVISRLLDPDDPEGLLRRPDVFLLTARTVHTARRV